MRVSFLDLKRQYNMISSEIDVRLNEVLSSCNFILGPNVSLIEKQIAKLCGASYAVACANGTDALVMALEALGIGAGDEVITTSFTFFATAEAIARVGARPIFVDIKESDYNMNENLIEEKITDKTKAIMPVHIFGAPCNMSKINEIAKKYNLKVIEDACQAIGAAHKSEPVGSLSDIACFSFFPTKNLGCYGDGGMMVTDDYEIYEKLKMMRFHGQRIKYENEMMGYNSRLDEMQAAILNVKIAYLDMWNKRRIAIAKRYMTEIKNKDILMPLYREEDSVVFHLFSVKSDNRENLIKLLNEKGIETGIYYRIPLHLQRAFEGLGYSYGDLPVTETLCDKIFSLPIYPEMTEDEVSYVIETLNANM